MGAASLLEAYLETLAVERGASVVRVHDVRETEAALAVWSAMQRAG